jgi:D-beta-D-heptose 7-phosphate kinase/D-beta-D-heptose 1-phosphate adenosyltransferase
MTARGPLVIVGDTLLDVDIEGPARRLSPEAPVPVVECEQQRYRPGGAGLAAVLAADLARPGGPAVVLITALGQDPAADRLRELLGQQHVEVLALPLAGATACKVRIRAAGQAVVRVDGGDGRAAPGPLGPAVRQALLGAGAILVSDYGRGVTAHPELAALLGSLPAAVPVVWDPHPAGQPPAAAARLVTPNRSEARSLAAALGGGVPGPPAPPPAGGSPVAQAARDASCLAREWGTTVAVTLGEVGAVLSSGDGVPVVVPAPELPPALAHDTCGAGDAFAAAAALALAAGVLLTEAVAAGVRHATGFVAAGGAGRAPGIAGPRGPGGAPLDLIGVVAPGGGAEPAPDAAGRAPAAGPGWEVVAGVRARGGRVVATGGCFDLLHAGHVGLLREARRLGDCLIVCLNSDSSVAALKGPGRPLVSQEDRAAVLAALTSVDAVMIFDEPAPSALLERLRPDVWVKGGDYAHADLAEAEVVRRHGGEVILLPYLSHHSTSRMVAAARNASEPAAPSPAR